MVDLASCADSSGEWLKAIRELASRNNIVLVFDESLSGFRSCYGGLHKSLRVEPDIAVYGSALANGYNLAAIVGRKTVMGAVQVEAPCSISDVDCMGFSAALKTLKIMERERSWEVVIKIGRTFLNDGKSRQKTTDYQLSANLGGYPRFSVFRVQMPSSMKPFLHRICWRRAFLPLKLFTQVFRIHRK